MWLTPAHARPSGMLFTPPFTLHYRYAKRSAVSLRQGWLSQEQYSRRRQYNQECQYTRRCQYITCYQHILRHTYRSHTSEIFVTSTADVPEMVRKSQKFFPQHDGNRNFSGSVLCSHGQELRSFSDFLCDVVLCRVEVRLYTPIPYVAFEVNQDLAVSHCTNRGLMLGELPREGWLADVNTRVTVFPRTSRDVGTATANPAQQDHPYALQTLTQRLRYQLHRHWLGRTLLVVHTADANDHVQNLRCQGTGCADRRTRALELARILSVRALPAESR